MFGLKPIIANSSLFLCKAFLRNYCYDLNLHAIKKMPLLKLPMNVLGAETVNFKMSDRYLFALCIGEKLKIFGLPSFNRIREIDLNADQMKLVSTDYLALFDSKSRMVYLYEQDDEQISLAESIEDGFTLASDQNKSISFYNSNT